MTKTDFISEQVNITMFTKLILQLKSDRISFTVLMIRLLSSHHKIFAESISQGNIGWKILLCDHTCTHDGSAATFAATCHIKKSLNFVLKKNVHIISTAIVRKKN